MSPRDSRFHGYFEYNGNLEGNGLNPSHKMFGKRGNECDVASSCFFLTQSCKACKMRQNIYLAAAPEPVALGNFRQYFSRPPL